jgi:hypothetical protein
MMKHRLFVIRSLSSRKVYQDFHELSFSLPRRKLLIANSRNNFVLPLSHLTTQRSLSTRNRKSLYEILNVSPKATPQEIKLAYFREAKIWHPDMNPNNPKAVEMFKQISSAYEILRDPVRRRKYDATGYDESQGPRYQSQGGSQYGHAYTQADAEEIFREVQSDVEVITDAFKIYVQELQDELAYTAESVRRGDWNEVWESIKANKGVIFGIVVPAVIFLRFPPLIFMFWRGIILGSQLVFAGLVYTGNLNFASNWIWRRLIALSKEKLKHKRK